MPDILQENSLGLKRKFVDNGDGSYSEQVAASVAAPVGGATAVLQQTEINAIDGLYATIIDQPDAATTYECIAPPGTLASAAAWRCKRIVVSGTVTTITWAAGGAFTQIAANRASLTYA